MPKPLLRQFKVDDAESDNVVTILINTAASSAFDAQGEGGRGFAIETPAAWDTANIGFEVSDDKSTWYPVYNEFGSIVQISGVGTTEARICIAPPETWVVGSFRWLRLVSQDSSGVDVNQTAERELVIRALV
jgi:hypothetical protein